ncbi:SDR family NAD(P)-dependent oxidoreductase [Hoeflea sp.]|uniref:SDR family NAD(P)-dependent oxidoreductase n=1 Tax=Hoeflea sp. TaxID=1940281 RepID=UPI003B5206E2
MHVAITGATSGLGWELSRLYAARGCSLVLAGRNEQRLLEISELCRALGADVETQAVDTTDFEAMDAWLGQAYAKRPIDLFVANAGMGGSEVLVSDQAESSELARKILEVNTRATISSVAGLIPHMTERGSGHIVILGSISGRIGLPQSPVYCASKAALSVYADAIRRLLKPHGVSVTSVLPGFIDTPMSRSLDMARPWCWPAERAARRIARDVERRAAHSVFPWQLRFLIGVQNLLPAGVSDRILRIGQDMGLSQSR